MNAQTARVKKFLVAKLSSDDLRRLRTLAIDEKVTSEMEEQFPQAFDQPNARGDLVAKLLTFLKDKLDSDSHDTVKRALAVIAPGEVGDEDQPPKFEGRPPRAGIQAMDGAKARSQEDFERRFPDTARVSVS